ncbi:MAG TPA: restriction endonuclease subunit S [Opitutaceae bacterium]|jgi:type I restriction enzyme S subunit|nr:restriction endonuclease subunit S [Opitutaceae bacterium]
MNWKHTKLSDFLTERDGRIKYEHANQLGLQRIKKIDFSGNIHLDAETDTKTDMIRVKRGDLVISGINAAKGAIAVHGGEDDVLATIHYSAYEFNSGRISVEFLKWFFKSPEFSDLLREQIPGGIKTELKPKHILPLKVKLPKLSEQITIANRLNRFRLEQLKLEHEITHQQSLLAKLKQAVLHEAIQGKLTAGWRAAHPEVEPAKQLIHRIQAEKARLIAAKKLRPEKPLPKITGAETKFEIPKSWVWCRYGDLCEYVTSGSRGWQQYYADSGALFIRAQNIKTDNLNLDDETFVELPDKAEGTRAKVQKNDILITITGGNLAKTALIEDEFDEAYVSQHIALTRLIDTDLAKWIYQALITEAGPRAQLLGFSRGDKPGLNLPNVRHVLIPIPPIAEQAAVVERVEALMTICSAMEAEIEHSRTHADHLLQAVLKETFAPAEQRFAATMAQMDEKDPEAEIILLHSSPEFIRAVLAAEIVDRLHSDRTFGQIKLQKVIYLTEYIAQLAEIDSRPARFQNGPHDPSLIAQVETKMKDCEWFEAVPRSDGYGSEYRPLAKAGGHRDLFEQHWPKQAAAIRRLIEEMKTWKTERCERFATLYAAWNDLIIWQRLVSDDAILTEVLERWHPDKLQIPKAKWLETLSWMRSKGYIPTGFGHPTAPKPQPELFSSCSP